MILLDVKEKVASIDIDAQQTFTPLCPGELPVRDGHEIVDELNAQAQYASIRVGSKDAHPPNAIWLATDKEPQLTPIVGHPHVDVRWNSHAILGSKGFELIPGLPHVTSYDFFIWKGIEPDLHPYGCCYHDNSSILSTGVIEFLHARGISTVVLGGLATDYCVKLSALQFKKAGFRVVINLAACRGVAEDTTKQAISEMKTAGIVFVESAAELENARSYQ